MLKPLKYILLVVTCAVASAALMVGNLHKFRANRDPAAIRQVYDITHLRGPALDVAVKERLLSGLETFEDDRGFGVGLGHFAFATASGEKVLGCRAYQKISMTFEAEGMAVSGEKPKMVVEGGCEYSNDLAKINPLWIPVSRIFGEVPNDGEFSNYERPVQMKFSHVADHWPRKWVLVALQIQGKKGQVDVNRYEIAQILGQPFLINLEEEVP